MRLFLLLFICISVFSCNEEKTEQKADTSVFTDTAFPSVLPETAEKKENPPRDSVIPPQVYSNTRFKDVTVERIGDTYRVRGKAQVFEAAFSWVVEDGHNELKEGHEMTDAGAPEFGNFDFRVTVKKARENSVLHLILFESSPKDGSRQHELMIPLPAVEKKP